MSEEILVGIAVILVLGVTAQWLAWRLQVPSIVLLLGLGLIAGPATGFLEPDRLFGQTLIPVVSISVAIILFEGGLSLRYGEFREVGGVVTRLITVGTLTSLVVGAAGAFWILDLDLGLAILLGAVLVVTGPTVIGPLLAHVRPTGQVGSTLKWEGITIDPLGAMLAVLVFEATLVGGFRDVTSVAITGVLQTLAAGAAVGFVAAWLLVALLRRYLIPNFLQSPVSLMVVVGAFTAANQVQDEAGLLAATVMGVVLANQRRMRVTHIVEFKENLRVLLISGLFVVLAARIPRSSIADIGWDSALYLALLVLVARPLGVVLSTARSALSWRERVFLMVMAPRGIVAAAISSVLALELVRAGRTSAVRLVPEVFFVIVGTVLLYGLAARPAARLLGLVRTGAKETMIVGAHPWAREVARALQEQGVRVLLVDAERSNVMAARMAGLHAEHAGLLSEKALDRLHLEHIDRLLVMTPDEEFNSLAAIQFARHFEAGEVYRLSREREGGEADRAAGRVLFGRGITFADLATRFAAGAEIKATPITRQFSYEAFRRRYGEGALPLFLVDERGRLHVYTDDNQPAPGPGTTLVSLVRPDQVRLPWFPWSGADLRGLLRRRAG